MKTVKQLLAWVLIIVLGTLANTYLTDLTEALTVGIPITIMVSLIFSLPSFILFFIAMRLIIGKTIKGRIVENFILIGIHVLLTFFTFLPVAGPDLFKSEFNSLTMFLCYTVTGIVVWGIYLFSENTNLKYAEK